MSRKFSDLLKNITVAGAKAWMHNDMGSFANELGISSWKCYDEEFEERVKEVPILSWICTDTEVGIHAYFFDGALVCVTSQPARKSGVDFAWVSREAAERVRDFILTLTKEELDVEILAMDSEIHPSWFEQAGVPVPGEEA